MCLMVREHGFVWSSIDSLAAIPQPPEMAYLYFNAILPPFTPPSIYFNAVLPRSFHLPFYSKCQRTIVYFVFVPQ